MYPLSCYFLFFTATHLDPQSARHIIEHAAARRAVANNNLLCPTKLSLSIVQTVLLLSPGYFILCASCLFSHTLVFLLFP